MSATAGTDSGLRHRSSEAPGSKAAEGEDPVTGKRPQQQLRPPANPQAKPDNDGYKILAALTLFFVFLGGIAAVLYPWPEPVAATPCQGICSISPQPQASPGSPPGCQPEDPWQLLYPHVPKTAGTTMKSLVSSRKHLKAFEVVDMKEWRDAVPGGVVWLAPNEISATSAAEYERRFRSWMHSLVMGTNRPHRSVLIGHVFFHNFSEPLSQSRRDSKATDRVPLEKQQSRRGVTVLRDPIARLASQYAFDRNRAKSSQFQKAVREAQGDLPFAECATSEACRESNQLNRWCSLQTRYICGWGPDCNPGSDGGATPAMLARAKAHLEQLFAVVGIQEQWERTVALLEAKLPTYFEGLSAEYSAGNPANCGVGPRHWYQRHVLKEMCPYFRNKLVKGGAKHSLPAKGSPADQALRGACWADIELYDFAVRLLDAQAAACGV